MRLIEATDQRLIQKPDSRSRAFVFGDSFLLQRSIMRDKKDIATIDLPGFEPAAAPDVPAPDAAAKNPRSMPRSRRATLKQEQLELLDETDASGLPVWRRDDTLDLTGLPVWAPAR
jgi:hypothetical protein